MVWLKNLLLESFWLPIFLMSLSDAPFKAEVSRFFKWGQTFLKFSICSSDHSFPCLYFGILKFRVPLLAVGGGSSSSSSEDDDSADSFSELSDSSLLSRIRGDLLPLFPAQKIC
jgi:hypothetical protein